MYEIFIFKDKIKGFYFILFFHLLDRSPIFVHANSTLSGISTIRASNKMKIFNKEFETHLDYHTRAYFAFICTQRWFSLRLDLIVCFFMMFAVYSSILAKGILYSHQFFS